jgi:hypothetical protein
VKGNKNCEFHGPSLPGALGAGQKLPKIDQFSKILMHGDVEQEGLYQNCEIYNPWGSGFAPRGGQT